MATTSGVASSRRSRASRDAARPDSGRARRELTDDTRLFRREPWRPDKMFGRALPRPALPGQANMHVALAKAGAVAILLPSCPAAHRAPRLLSVLPGAS